MGEKKKNISSGAKKAQSLTRTDENKRKSEQAAGDTASVEELGNNRPVKATSGDRARRQSKKKNADTKAKKSNSAKDMARRKADRHKRAEANKERKLKARELKNERKKARAEEKKEARAAKIEARAAKREAAAAERQAKREHRLKVRAQKQAERKEKRHSPGFGGWLAAVISLGATSLVLATIVTYGWMNMSAMQTNMAGMQTQSLYELNSIVDNLDSNLAKARVSTSSTDRARVLADIAIESEMAEVVLERLPLEITLTEEMASFLNKMGDSAQSMLYTVAAGGELEEWQISSLEYMYRNNLKLKRALNEIVASAGSGDIIALMRGKGSVLEGSFNDIQNNVIEEPKGIFDGPFSQNSEDTNPSVFEGMAEVSQAEAEGIAREIFADYKVTDARCTGEATRGNLAFYNVTQMTDDGEILAQLSMMGGKMVMFDSYKECTQHNFSVERCRDIAADFLKALGFENLESVWVSENGTTCNINFCPVQNGVVLYPDMVKVKVCEERGIVTGAEAMSYVMNHSQRDIAGATITKAEAQSVIDGRIEVTSSRLALIPVDGQEVLCYEFAGKFDGSDYFVYVDAATGNEVQVLTVVGTAQGRAVL